MNISSIFNSGGCCKLGFMAKGKQRRNLALPGSPENGHSLKHTKNSEGSGDGKDYDKRKRRAVIMKTGVVCISNKTEITGVEGGVSEKQLCENEAMCAVCYKTFCSKKAMYGHMRCHPEREWRGAKPPPPLPSSPAKPASSSDSMPRKSDDFSPSAMKSTIVTNLGQPPVGWLVTGTRGQNHPFSFYDTLVSSTELGIKDKNQVDDHENNNNDDHGRGELADNDNNIEEEESGGKNTTDGGKNRNKMDQETVSEPLLVAAREYKCSSCDKVFRTFQGLGGHRASHRWHKNEVKAKDGGEEDSKEGGSKVVVDRFKCNFCSKIFPSGPALGGHKRTHFHGSTQATPSCQHTVSEEAGKSLGGKVLDFDINELPPMEE